MTMAERAARRTENSLVLPEASSHKQAASSPSPSMSPSNCTRHTPALEPFNACSMTARHLPMAVWSVR